MKNFILFFVAAFLVYIPMGLSQVITTIPVFPTASGLVTITFDATQGTGGLEDCSCDVYLHTGVITDQSTSQSDWKYVLTSWGVANNSWKMTPVSGQPNMYSFTMTPNIRAYYGVPINEIIEELAFVFRNADGSLEGKADGGTDIFYTIYPDDNEFTANLLAPTAASILASIGEDIEINAVSSEEADLSITDNGVVIASTTGTGLIHTINVSGSGTHTVIYSADNGSQILHDTFTYTIPLASVVQELPDNIKPGINYIDGSTVVLSLYAPNKNHVFLIGDFNNWNINTDYQLKNTTNGNTWWIEISGLNPGEEYAFQYLVDGNIRIADPYAEKVLDPWNDGSISNSIYPNLKAYPAGQTTGVVAIFQTNQAVYPWTDQDFVYPEKSKLFVYELLMRDFLSSHSYIDLLDTLDYLERLGVTAIELMPVSEFEGNQSWGYNPSFHGALDKYYGTPEAFKDFINEAHNRGIAVILDVVYNHAFSQSPLAQLYWDAGNFKPSPDNPWLNPDAKHPYNVGYDFNHESDVTKNYVKQTLATWIESYHIDGFRFDLSKGFTQNQTTENNFSNYDASRIAILKDYADFVWSLDPDNYVILEHFATNSEEKELAEYGMMIWGNMNHEYNEASMGYPSNLSWVSHQQRNWNVPHVVGYMESHDEERQMFKNEQFGNSSGSYDVTDVNTGLARVELTSAFFFTIPGPKMIWQFGELGYDFSINRCTNGTISPNCRLDPKPIRWDYQNNPNRMRIYNVMSKLAQLKKTEEVFSTDDFDYSLNGSTKKIHLNGTDNLVTVLGNFGVSSSSINPGFQQTGWWYELFTGDSIMVSDVNSIINLEAGEYRLYSSQKLITSIKNLSHNDLPVLVYPNPSSGRTNIKLGIENTPHLKIDLVNLSGQHISTLHNTTFTKGQHLTFKLNQNPGLYLIKIIIGPAVYYKKIVIQ